MIILPLRSRTEYLFSLTDTKNGVNIKEWVESLRGEITENRSNEKAKDELKVLCGCILERSRSVRLQREAGPSYRSHERAFTDEVLGHVAVSCLELALRARFLDAITEMKGATPAFVFHAIGRSFNVLSFQRTVKG